MITPESSEHTTGRFEHPNPEVEEIDFKRNIMKVIQSLKQDVKSSLKEMGEKNNKKFEEMNKSLKDTLGNQEKAMKQVMETVPGLKNEMEVMKKAQTKGQLDMETMGK